MAESANVETIRRLYSEHLSRPERLTDPAILTFFDPDVVIEQHASFLGTGGTFFGYEGLFKAAREVLEVADDVHYPLKDLEEFDEHVLATVIVAGRGRLSGVPLETEVIHAWKLREGRVIRWRVCLDRDEAMAAITGTV